MFNVNITLDVFILQKSEIKYLMSILHLTSLFYRNLKSNVTLDVFILQKSEIKYLMSILHLITLKMNCAYNIFFYVCFKHHPNNKFGKHSVHILKKWYIEQL